MGLILNYKIEDIKISDFNSLGSDLDLSTFDNLIKKAQDEQINAELTQIETEVTRAAYDFLRTLQIAQNKIRQAEILANKLKQIRHMYQSQLPKIRNKTQSQKSEYGENINFTDNDLFSNYNEAKDYMNELFNSEEVKEVYKKAEIFNNKLIQFTQGRELKTIISVTGEDGHPILYEVDMERFIDERMKFGYDSGDIARLSANFNVGSYQIAEKLQSLKRLENDDSNQEGLNKTVIDVLERYKISGKRRYIMQKLSDGQRKAKVPTQGDIAEAYSFFYFSKKFYFNADREQNVDTFIMQGVVNVDAISGMYQGDISLADQVYDYAIKKGNASFLELAQMVKLTEQILLTVKNKQSLKKLIESEYDKEKKKNEGAIRTSVSKVGGQTVSKAMKKYLSGT